MVNYMADDFHRWSSLHARQ